MTNTFFTASETSRLLNVPLSALLRLVRAGAVPVAGRAGTGANAAFIFRASDIGEIRKVVAEPWPVFAASTQGPKRSVSKSGPRSTDEIRAAAAAIRRGLRQ